MMNYHSDIHRSSSVERAPLSVGDRMLKERDVARPARLRPRATLLVWVVVGIVPWAVIAGLNYWG
jgi:hypothetical protein